VRNYYGPAARVALQGDLESLPEPV